MLFTQNSQCYKASLSSISIYSIKLYWSHCKQSTYIYSNINDNFTAKSFTFVGMKFRGFEVDTFFSRSKLSDCVGTYYTVLSKHIYKVNSF